ncbi:MAG: hypothetical protein LBR29_02035 [Methylobacteriaceae bacterium]|nr:hypothetical protein [Methylobacteriaceae bacterium]
MSERGKRQVTKIDEQLKKYGAVIVTRVIDPRGGCAISEVRLRPVRDGKIDDSVFYTVGVTNFASGKPHVESMGEFVKKSVTLQIGTLLKDIEIRDEMTSFEPIPPGDYAVTSAICNRSTPKHTDMSRIGRDIVTFTKTETGFREPVPGANFIRVRKGDVLDAGFLQIVFKGEGKGFNTKTYDSGELVAVPVPQEYKDYLQSEMPDFYARLRFDVFTGGRFKE